MLTSGRSTPESFGRPFPLPALAVAVAVGPAAVVRDPDEKGFTVLFLGPPHLTSGDCSVKVVVEADGEVDNEDDRELGGVIKWKSDVELDMEGGGVSGGDERPWLLVANGETVNVDGAAAEAVM